MRAARLIARAWLWLFADVRTELRKEPIMVAATDIPPYFPEPPPSFVTVPRPAGHVPVDEITARARSMRPGKSLLNVIGAVLFGTAWVLAKILGGAWLCVAWCQAACAMGWADARGKGPSKSAYMEENLALRAEVRRLGGDA